MRIFLPPPSTFGSAVLIASALVSVCGEATAQPVLSPEHRRLLSQTTYTLVSYSGRPSASYLQGLNVTFREHQVTRGDKLSTLLRRNGVEPDANAYTVVYAANPQLADVDELEIGQPLFIPTIEGPSLLEATLERRQLLIRLGIYGALRQRLAEETDQVIRSLGTVLLVPDRYLPPGPSRDPLMRAGEQLRHRLAAIDFERTVVGEQILELVTFELELLAKELSNTLLTQEPLDAEAAALISMIESSVEELTRCARTAVNCEVPVQVRTRDGDGVERNGIQVYAAPFALYGSRECAVDTRCRRAFRRVSSPAEHELAADAHFMFWAERNGRVISERKAWRPTRDGSNVVDLLLTEP